MNEETNESGFPAGIIALAVVVPLVLVFTIVTCGLLFLFSQAGAF